MTIEEVIIEKLRALPPDKQKQTLDFIERLQQRPSKERPFESCLGVCTDLNVTISAAEIDEARREVWASFPREGMFAEETK